MIIAVMSDLHLEFRRPIKKPADSSYKKFCDRLILPETIEADVIVIAGDTHPKAQVRNKLVEQLMEHYKIPVILVTGNHDYYGSFFPEGQPTIKSVIDIGGKTCSFLYATAWTYLRLSDVPLPGSMYGINDVFQIKNFNVEAWTRTHKLQVDQLLTDQSDVVITHHALCKKSVIARYEGHPLNPFFVTDYTPIIERFTKTKLMIHGHMHSKLDYMVGSCQIVCNPLGYPGEMYATDYEYRPMLVAV